MNDCIHNHKKGDASGIPVAYIVTVIILIAFLAFMFFFMQSNDSYLTSLTDRFQSIFRFNEDRMDNKKTSVQKQKKGASLVLILVIVVLLVFLFTILYVFFNPNSGRLGKIKDASDDFVGEKIDVIEENTGQGTGKTNRTAAPPALRGSYDSFLSSLNQVRNSSDCYTTIPVLTDEKFGTSGSDTTYTTVIFDPLVRGEGTLVSLSRGYGEMDYTRDTIDLNIDIIDTQARVDSFRERIYTSTQISSSSDDKRIRFMDSYTLHVNSQQEQSEEEYDVVTVDDHYLLYVIDNTVYFIRNCAGLFDGCRGGNSQYRALVQGGENIALPQCQND